MGDSFDKDAELLEEVGRSLGQPSDGELVKCWEVVMQALSYRQFTFEDVQESIRYLRNGEDYGTNEFGLESMGDRLRVSFLGEPVLCSRQAMIRQLERLRDRYTAIKTGRTSAAVGASRASLFDHNVNIPKDAALARPEQDHDGPSNNVPDTVPQAAREHSA